MSVKNGKITLKNGTTDLKTLLSGLVTAINTAISSIVDSHGDTVVTFTQVPDNFGNLLET